MRRSPAAQRASASLVVIGGGITGLSAAYALQQQASAQQLNVSITLVEESQRLGGKIVTDQVDGFTVEGGPDCFLRQKPWAAQLAHSLGIQEDLVGTNDRQRKIYVLSDGRLTALPDGVMLIIPTRVTPFVLSHLISWPGKMRMGLDWFIPRHKGAADESVADFVRRRLGREALEKIAGPLLSGVHVSDAEKQSLLATFPRFRSIEEKHGSLIRGMLAERKHARAFLATGKRPGSIFMSFKQGLGRLPQALEAALTGCRLIKGKGVVSIARCDPGGYLVRLSDSETLSADALILTTPANDAADLLLPIAPDSAAMLQDIEYVSTATVSLAYRKADIRRPFMGFGFVVSLRDKRGISACTWSSYKFDQRAPVDHLLLRCFLGGPGQENVLDQDDEYLVQAARGELADILGLDAAPVLKRIYRWPKAHPQYNLGHLDHVKRIFDLCSEETPGIFLAGAAYLGVGVPDCVRQGEEAAKSVLQYLSKESGR